MSENISGGPAFPRTGFGNAGTKYGVPSQEGMTLLDYFAAKAMQGALAADNDFDLSETELAANAYSIAEAMLAERSKRGVK